MLNMFNIKPHMLIFYLKQACSQSFLLTFDNDRVLGKITVLVKCFEAFQNLGSTIPSF